MKQLNTKVDAINAPAKTTRTSKSTKKTTTPKKK